MEHIKTLNTKNLQNTVKKRKTSCTVGNQSCEHK